MNLKITAAIVSSLWMGIKAISSSFASAFYKCKPIIIKCGTHISGAIGDSFSPNGVIASPDEPNATAFLGNSITHYDRREPHVVDVKKTKIRP